jgi:hypothetical protein
MSGTGVLSKGVLLMNSISGNNPSSNLAIQESSTIRNRKNRQIPAGKTTEKVANNALAIISESNNGVPNSSHNSPTNSSVSTANILIPICVKKALAEPEPSNLDSDEIDKEMDAFITSRQVKASSAEQTESVIHVFKKIKPELEYLSQKPDIPVAEFITSALKLICWMNENCSKIIAVLEDVDKYMQKFSGKPFDEEQIKIFIEIGLLEDDIDIVTVSDEEKIAINRAIDTRLNVFKKKKEALKKLIDTFGYRNLRASWNDSVAIVKNLNEYIHQLGNKDPTTKKLIEDNFHLLDSQFKLDIEEKIKIHTSFFQKIEIQNLAEETRKFRKTVNEETAEKHLTKQEDRDLKFKICSLSISFFQPYEELEAIRGILIPPFTEIEKNCRIVTERRNHYIKEIETLLALNANKIIYLADQLNTLHYCMENPKILSKHRLNGYLPSILGGSGISTTSAAQVWDKRLPPPFKPRDPTSQSPLQYFNPEYKVYCEQYILDYKDN